MSILNKYKRWMPMLIPINDEYMDFVISQDGTPSIPYNGNLTERCLAAYVDFANRNSVSNGKAMSLPDYAWEKSVNEGVSLYNIGYTGIDNGLLYYGGWGRVSNKQFFDIFTKSKYEIEAGDMRLKMHAVTGNSEVYSYDYKEINREERYYALKGGFFQGFYKLFGSKYEILPQYIQDGWNLEIVIRPKDYEIKDNTLNKTHEGNEGIFFYMGTRAENKFAQFYNTDLSKYQERKQREVQLCEDILNGELYIKEVEPDECNNYYQEDEPTFSVIMKSYNDSLRGDKKFNKMKAGWLTYFMNTYGYSEYNNCDCPDRSDTIIIPDEKENCSNYFADDFLSDCDNSFTFDPEYFEGDVVISGATLTTADGVPIEANGYYEIETDNKFLTFNRTKYGFTTANFDEDTVVVLTGITNNFDGNLFLLMNRTPNGYTTETIHEYYAKEGNKYDPIPSIKGNSFALKYNEDGSIGYRYLIKSCDTESGFEIVEESTFPGMIKKNEWNIINVAFRVLDGALDDCGKPLGPRKIKIYIYINGYLKFVSKELPDFNFRELDEIAEKQEGVPFNISVGGGTQGLCDSIWLDYWKAFEKILPIEENFAGTFIGDIRSFKFYTCPLEYAEVRNNYLYERHKRK